jgi:hypothetical protein
VVGAQPVGLQLRYLQTLSEIATEKQATIIFPLPLEMLHMVNPPVGDGRD